MAVHQSPATILAEPFFPLAAEQHPADDGTDPRIISMASSGLLTSGASLGSLSMSAVLSTQPVGSRRSSNAGAGEGFPKIHSSGTVTPSLTPPEGAILKPHEPSDADSMIVMDPRGRKMRLPKSIVTPTKAVFATGAPCLCVLHLDGRCRQQGECHQVHAEREAVEKLRAAALAHISCCGDHGDPDGAKMPADAGGVVVGDKKVPTARLAFTWGLARAMKAAKCGGDVTPSVPEPSLCRLHAVDKCYFGDDCKFVHVCRRFIADHFPTVIAEGQALVRKKKYGSGRDVAAAPPLPPKTTAPTTTRHPHVSPAQMMPPVFGAAPPQYAPMPPQAPPLGQVVLVPLGAACRPQHAVALPQPTAPLPYTYTTPPPIPVPDHQSFQPFQLTYVLPSSGVGAFVP